MSHHLVRSFDPRECLEMEIKEDRSSLPIAKSEPPPHLTLPELNVSSTNPHHHQPNSTTTPTTTSQPPPPLPPPPQPPVSNEAGFFIQIPWAEHEEHINFEKPTSNHLEDISENTIIPYYKKNKEALYKLLLEDEECSFKCNQCSFETIYRIDILRHMKTHSRPQKMFPCSLCPYVASQKHHLQTHISSRHTQEKPFACNICNYCSATKAHLQTHLLSHSSEKPFKCPTCPYSTARKGNLQTHLIIHMENKPHHCPYCSYSASQKTHLQSHLVVHTGEKPFTCNQCSYSAAKKTSLQIHVMMTHTGEKPFSCPECTYSTAQKGNLQRHMKIHNRDRVKPNISDSEDYNSLDNNYIGSSTGNVGERSTRPSRGSASVNYDRDRVKPIITEPTEFNNYCVNPSVSVADSRARNGPSREGNIPSYDRDRVKPVISEPEQFTKLENSYCVNTTVSCGSVSDTRATSASGENESGMVNSYVKDVKLYDVQH